MRSRSKRTGYGSTPRARSASRSASRRARSAGTSSDGWSSRASSGVVGHPVDARCGDRALRTVRPGDRDVAAVDAAAATRRSNMEAVIVATARSPDRTGQQGLARRPAAPTTSAPTIVQALLEKVPAARPGRGRGRDLGLRAARRRGGLQPRPRHRAARRARRRAGRHRQPLLLVVAPDHPHGRARDQGRRGRRVRRRRRRDREPLPRRACPTAGPARTTRSSPTPRRAPSTGAHGGQRAVGADRRPPRHLHRDGPDRRERRRVRQGHPRGDGRVRRAVAAARGRVAGERVLRA